MEIRKVNLTESFNKIKEYWDPHVVGDLNDQQVKLAKIKGEFVAHKHDNEDELFFVIKGKLLIKLRDQDISLNPGEFAIIPKGIEHLPVAEEEVHVMLIEPKTTLNTGDTKGKLTKETLDVI